MDLITYPHGSFTMEPIETMEKKIKKNKILSLDSHITSHRITSHQSPFPSVYSLSLRNYLLQGSSTGEDTIVRHFQLTSTHKLILSSSFAVEWREREGGRIDDPMCFLPTLTRDRQTERESRSNIHPPHTWKSNNKLSLCS